MKLLAGRPKDLEDVVAIIAAQGNTLDLAQTRATVQLLESALDQSDLMPELERALARTARPG